MGCSFILVVLIVDHKYGYRNKVLRKTDFKTGLQLSGLIIFCSLPVIYDILYTCIFTFSFMGAQG